MDDPNDPFNNATSETSSIPARKANPIWDIRNLAVLAILAISLPLAWLYGNHSAQAKASSRISRMVERENALTANGDRLLLDAELAREAAASSEAHLSSLRKERDTLLEEKSVLIDRIGAMEGASSALSQGLEASLEQAKERLRQTEAEFRNYQERYKVNIRSRAPGTDLGNFRYRNVVFQNARIERVTPAGIDIRHDSGAAHLLFSLLPEFLRSRYGYDDEEAALFLEGEHTAQLKNEAIKDQKKIERREALADQDRRIAQRQAESKGRTILARLRQAEADLATARQKATNPGRHSAKDYEREIGLRERDIAYYKKQLEQLGLSRKQVEDTL